MKKRTEEESGADFIGYSPIERLQPLTITPRLLFLLPNGSYPLVRNKDWCGLPGGKIKIGEQTINQNMLHLATVWPTMEREFSEECGVRIESYIEKSTCLALVELVVITKKVREIITDLHCMLSIVFLAIARADTPITLAEEMQQYSKNVVLANIWEEKPRLLFPDADFAIEHLLSHRGREKSIAPTFCPIPVFFQIKPRMGYHLPFHKNAEVRFVNNE